jgi:endoglucanase
MPVPDVLRKLLTAPGPSGYEQAAAAVFRDSAKGFAEVSNDSVGSSVARVKGTADGKLLAVVGHIDEIGLIVHHIDDEGFLWFTGVGGWDPIILVGQRVDVATRDGAVPGVVGKKPIHLMRDEDRKSVPELRNLHIDIGAKDGDDARSKVRIGDVAGVAVTQEEITFGGSRTTAYSLRPDVAIVVDVTFATDQPGVDEKELGKHKLGTGPVIGRGSTLDPLVFELLHAAGEEAGIPFTVQASARYTGTDADAFHISRGGIPTGVVSIPLRYMHSPVEMVQLDDVENAAKLIAAFAQKLTADLDFKR